MKAKFPGRQPTRAEELLLLSLVPRNSEDEVVVIHHFINDIRFLQIELERKSASNGITFERLVL